MLSVTVEIIYKMPSILFNRASTHSVFLPGKSHRQRSLVGYGPGGRRESDTPGAELDEEHPAECQLESPQLRGGFRAPITASSDERGGEGGPGWVVTQL